MIHECCANCLYVVYVVQVLADPLALPQLIP
jgi:hypothetical protein